MGVHSVSSYVMKLRGPRSDIVKELREIIRKAAPDAQESYKWAQPVYEQNGPFCYISAHSDHIAVGFWRGGEIKAPEGLLVGDGKMRHLKIASMEEIKPKVIEKLVKIAVALNIKKGNPVLGG
jgi:hypothetical protein